MPWSPSGFQTKVLFICFICVCVCVCVPLSLRRPILLVWYLSAVLYHQSRSQAPLFFEMTKASYVLRSLINLNVLVILYSVV